MPKAEVLVLLAAVAMHSNVSESTREPFSYKLSSNSINITRTRLERCSCFVAGEMRALLAGPRGGRRGRGRGREGGGQLLRQVHDPAAE